MSEGAVGMVLKVNYHLHLSHLMSERTNG